MREVNFSIPNVNKASVGITTALYDRRALDCTSTLPLINSLNHLAYLTTSSARIRDILTVDGGIERLVCILKQGRSKDMMDMWKWNLAFQCVVNIGVRGTEAVRTRVVEADMVPVIATILDNYIKVIEKCREKAEEAKQRHAHEHHGRQRLNDLRVANKSSSFTHRTASSSRLELDQHRSFRRQAPPPSIDVSATFSGPTTVASGEASSSSAAAAAATAIASGSTTGTGSTALSTASSTDGSTSNTDNDATPTMAQFHITSPQHSARSSISSPLPLPVPAQSALPSTLITPGSTPARRFHHHHHHHHHAAAGPSSSSSSATATPTAPSSSSASMAAAAAVAAATSATPSRHSVSTPFGTVIQPLSAATPTAVSVSAAEVNEANLMRSALEQYPAPFGLRPVLGNSQPASPTTPLPPPQLRSPTVRPTSLLAPTGRSRRRPSIRHQNSTSGPSNEVDDLNAESVQSDETGDAEMSGTGEMQTMQTTVDIQDINMEESDSMLGGEALELTTPTVSETQDTGAFNITHRGPMDGSIAPAAAAAPVPTMGMSPNRPAMVTAQQPVMPTTSVPRYLLDRQLTPHPQVIASMPREEDVLMSLQLLAYVSKYCNLRSYFQKSHLVPRLKIGKELQLLDGDDLGHVEGSSSGHHSHHHHNSSRAKMEEDGDLDDNMNGSSLSAVSSGSSMSGAALDDLSNSDIEEEEEYLLPNDLNIFPLVEKFTVRYHSTDMQYWAGVVMRNLCRKDESRGGIRQCAYYQCGKWEEYTRQFAKCRRCRRTKYCSKECQKSAWAFHRHWCVAATQ
ncbi:hypothetical protein SBRCBS47491_000961 [Sporothrix bragantina]|uniref:MYND-type zinc finger protein samB n=1 Tax=Sporothrix bragantina TaxID=671064 RepID=A0ABP0AUN2_9PEZI